jgi:hypothetical protein
VKTVIALFFASLAFGQSVPAVNTPIATTWPLSAVPIWVKVVVANSSTNFTVTCTGPASLVCGTSPVAKAAGLTQSVVLATPGASFVLDNCVVKSGTAFAGPTTLTGTVGISGTLTGCVSVGYNLEAAVSATNFGLPTVVTSGVSTNGTDSIILALTSTVQNISTISAGSVTVWLKLVLLP